MGSLALGLGRASIGSGGGISFGALGCKGFGCYPYQELVLDLATYPPNVFGIRLWPSLPTTLPDRALFTGVGGSAIWPVDDIPLPRPAHADHLRDGAPQLAVGQVSIAASVVPGTKAPTVLVKVLNVGTGPMGWRASIVKLDGEEVPWLALDQTTTIDDGAVVITFDARALGLGTYHAELTIDAPLSEGSPRVIPVSLTVAEQRTFVPGLSRH